MKLAEAVAKFLINESSHARTETRQEFRVELASSLSSRAISPVAKVAKTFVHPWPPKLLASFATGSLCCDDRLEAYPTFCTETLGEFRYDLPRT